MTAGTAPAPARAVRAVRGAVQVDRDDPAAIRAGTRDLLTGLMLRNGLTQEDFVSVVFTTTPDLASAFPAAAARELDFADVPLLCAVEIDVPGAMPRVVRLLAHVETDLSRRQLTHVYLGGAARLRPDLADRDRPRAGPPAPGPA